MACTASLGPRFREVAHMTPSDHDHREGLGQVILYAQAWYALPVLLTVYARVFRPSELRSSTFKRCSLLRLCAGLCRQGYGSAECVASRSG